jgi:preprotein translocase subunit SecG
MLTVLITIVHVVVALILILVVLLQTGKRADLAGAFGGGGSQTAFGTRGAATLLSKVTTTAAVLFMLTSMGLSILSSQKGVGGDTVLPADEPGTPGPADFRPAPMGETEGMPALPEQQPEPLSEPPAEDQQS